MSNKCKCTNCGCSKWRVDIIESEKGWGAKIDDIKLFNTEDEAVEYHDTFNKAHIKTGPTPDIYWYANEPYKVKAQDVTMAQILVWKDCRDEHALYPTYWESTESYVDSLVEDAWERYTERWFERNMPLMALRIVNALKSMSCNSDINLYLTNNFHHLRKWVQFCNHQRFNSIHKYSGGYNIFHHKISSVN